MVAALFMQSRDDMTAKQKQAALVAFRVTQAAAIAEAAINATLAASNALASVPFPANIPAAVAMGIAGAAQVATIAAQQPPEFPTGGIVRPSPDHQLIAAQPGEGVVSRRGMQALGEEGLHALNRGEQPGPQVQVIQMVYKHRVFQPFIADHLRRPGPLRDALNRGRTPGRSPR